MLPFSSSILFASLTLTSAAPSHIVTDAYEAQFPQALEVAPYGLKFTCQAESDLGRLVVNTGITNGATQRPLAQLGFCDGWDSDWGQRPLTMSIPFQSEFKNLKMTGARLEGLDGRSSLSFIYADLERADGVHVYSCYASGGSQSGTYPNVCYGARSDMTFEVRGENLVVHWKGDDLQLPLFSVQGRDVYEVADPTPVIQEFLNLSPDEQNRKVGLFAAHAYHQDPAYQAKILETVQAWYQRNPDATSTFAVALGNMGSPLSMPMAEPYLNSDKIPDLSLGLGMIRRVQTPESRAAVMQVLTKAYPKAVDVGSNWGDFRARSLVDEALQSLKDGQLPSEAEMEALRQLKAATPGDYWRLDEFLKNPERF